jgi:tetratricopeptide (TPR) repeat protein
MASKHVITIGSAIFVTVVASLAGVAFSGAAMDHGIVIEQLRVPDDLSKTGLDGQVLAARLSDRLKELRSLSANTADNAALRVQPPEVPIKVQVSGASVSLDELYNELRYWLSSSNEIYVSGEVDSVPGGAGQYQLKLRTSVAEPQTCMPSSEHVRVSNLEASANHLPPRRNLDTQIELAAQCAFEFVERERFAEYTLNNAENARRHCESETPDGAPPSQLVLRAQEQATARSYKEAIMSYREELALRKGNASAWCAIAGVYSSLARQKFQEVIDSSTSSSDRAWANYGLGKLAAANAARPDAVQYFRQAIQLDPALTLAYVNLADVYGELGRDEEQLATTQTLVNMLDSGDSDGLDEEARKARSREYHGQLADDLGDYVEAVKIRETILRASENSGNDEDHDTAQKDRLTSLAFDHDAPATASAVATAIASKTAPDSGTMIAAKAGLENWTAIAEMCAPKGSDADACENDDGSAPWASYALVRTALQSRPVNVNMLRQGLKYYASVNPDCYLCVRMEARGLALLHWDRQVEPFYEHLAREFPDIPFAYAEWGRWLLDRGDTDGAIARFQDATRHGPHYADGWEGLGEAHLRKCAVAAAIEDFAQAERFAPHWAKPHLEYNEALKLAGQGNDGLKIGCGRR